MTISSTSSTITIPFKYVSYQQNAVHNLSITIDKGFIGGPALKKEIMDEIKKFTQIAIPSHIRLFSGDIERETHDFMMYYPSEIRDCSYEFIVLESEIETAKHMQKFYSKIGKRALKYLSDNFIF